MELDSEEILNALRKDGFILIPSFLTHEEVEKTRAEYFLSLSRLEPHPPSQRFDPGNLKITPWRKFAVGSRNGSGDPYSQVLQTTYFSPSAPDYPVLGSVFSRLIALRNTLTDMPSGYGSDLRKDAFWNACRVHHYPRGGGHMASHVDSRFPKLLADAEFKFIQVATTLSNRGKDFNSGGGFLVDRRGQSVYLESEDNAGSLVVFDGSVDHGVEDIDPDQLMTFESTAGRIALFVNLYPNQHVIK